MKLLVACLSFFPNNNNNNNNNNNKYNNNNSMVYAVILIPMIYNLAFTKTLCTILYEYIFTG